MIVLNIYIYKCIFYINLFFTEHKTTIITVLQTTDMTLCGILYATDIKNKNTDITILETSMNYLSIIIKIIFQRVIII